MVSKATRTGNGQSLALVILAGIDIVLGMIAVAIAISAGWPGLDSLSLKPTDANIIIGAGYLTLAVQIVLRLVMLILMAWWTYRLVNNAHQHSKFPVSIRWSWLGWFVPVASLWLPLQTILNLNLKRSNLSGGKRTVIFSWWMARLLVSPSLACASMILIGIFVSLNNQSIPNTIITIHWCVWLLITGVTAQSLAIAVVLITQRHQPKPGEIVTADLF